MATLQDTAFDKNARQKAVTSMDDLRPPIDLAHLRRYTMGDQGLEAEIIALFFAQLPQTLAGFRDARTVVDARHAAHTLKGSARAIGAWAIAAVAEQLEQMVTGPDSQFRPKAPAIETLLKRIDEETALAKAFAMAVRPAPGS